MAHVRKQIRDAVVTLLKANVSLVSRRVFSSRVYALTTPDLPAVTVYTGSESSSLMTIGARTMSRELSLQVDLYVRFVDTFDDKVDAIAVQVEEAIANDFSIGGLAKSAVLTSTEIEYSGEAEQPIGIARLTFSIQYITTINDVEQAR